MKRTLPHLRERLDALERDGLLRVAPAPLVPDALSFASNDYLGLASRPAPPAPAGGGASRLVAGERREHGELERAVASWLGADAALAFSSGYAANVGALAALAAPGDVVVSDALNHASIVDGARLSRAEVQVFPHNDLSAVRSILRSTAPKRAWVVVESYFSMDADGPDLSALRAICDEAGALLYVDEAHALGVFGPSGRGRCAEAGVDADVLVGTFGKAFGSAGAFVAGSADLRSWLWNRARSFVFSTALSPSTAAAALDALALAERSPRLRERALARALQLREGLAAMGLDIRGFGPIVPWVLGEAALAVRTSRALAARGVHAPPIRPPTVPPGTARLRLTVTARHTEADIALALAAIQEVL